MVWVSHLKESPAGWRGESGRGDECRLQGFRVLADDLSDLGEREPAVVVLRQALPDAPAAASREYSRPLHHFGWQQGLGLLRTIRV